YGPASAKPEYAALAGSIFETQNGQAVAFVRAKAGPEDVEPAHKDRLSQDHRHCDLHDLAFHKFQQQVRRCVMELIPRDQHTATTGPSPWQAATTRRAAPQIIILPAEPMGRSPFYGR